MKKMFVLIVMITIFITSNVCFALEPFEKDTNYDIYYQITSDEANIIKNIKIIRIVNINDKEFLEISRSGFGDSGKRGFILFSSIKSILPAGNIDSLQTKDKI